MDHMAGSGALDMLGVNPLPAGTPEELTRVGLDPANVASCHPEAPGVTRGCPLWKECRFHLPKMGGFKGKSGPHYVGYFLQTHEGKRKEDFVTCHAFVRTLQSRMDAGITERQKGRPHELIRIVAQEGEKIVTRIGVPNNEADKSLTAGYHYQTSTIEVPKFPRPGENERVTYDQQLAAREQERQRREDEVETAMHQASRMEIPTTEEPFEIDMTVSTDPPTPEPAGKKK